MDLRDWFFSVSTAHNFANLDFSFSNEVTLIFSFNLLRGGTPGLELPYLHLAGYEPKVSDARRFDTWFVLLFKLYQYKLYQYELVCYKFGSPSYPPRRRDSSSKSSIEVTRVIRRLRLQLFVDPPSRTTIVVSQNASVVSCWLTLITKACHSPFV